MHILKNTVVFFSYGLLVAACQPDSKPVSESLLQESFQSKSISSVYVSDNG